VTVYAAVIACCFCGLSAADSFVFCCCRSFVIVAGLSWYCRCCCQQLGAGFQPPLGVCFGL